MLWNLKIRLRELKLRQRDLARLVGVSAVTVCTIISGHSKPRKELRARIAKVLGVSEAVLFSEKVRGARFDEPHRKEVERAAVT